MRRWAGWCLQFLPVLRLWNPKLRIYDNSVHELGSLYNHFQQTLEGTGNLWLVPESGTMRMSRFPVRSAYGLPTPSASLGNPTKLKCGVIHGLHLIHGLGSRLWVQSLSWGQDTFP